MPLQSFTRESSGVRLVLSTAPDIAVARQLASALVEERLAACVSLLPGLESTYRWQGKTETSAEILLLIKTAEEKVEVLLARLPQLHPYEVPEALVFPVESGLAAYLAWVREGV